MSERPNEDDFQPAAVDRRVLGHIDTGGFTATWAELAPIFQGAQSLAEVEHQITSAIAVGVERILELTAGYDAFDIAELMRLREIPPAPAMALEAGYDGSGAALELVNLVLTCRPDRTATAVGGAAQDPHLVIAELHSIALRLLRMATFKSLAIESWEDGGSIKRLAVEYQSYLVNVRGLQYESVQDEHDAALFERPAVEVIVRSALGFTYKDFVTVREGIRDLYSDRLTHLIDTVGDLVARGQAEGREPDGDEIVVFKQSMRDWMFVPGDRASFTADDIAAGTGLDVDLARVVLDKFSIGFDPARDPVAAVTRYLQGRNPLAEGVLLADGLGNYVVAGCQIGGDTFRTWAEPAIKKGTNWTKYDQKHRAVVSEGLANQFTEKLLMTAPAHRNLKYYAPKTGEPPEALSAECIRPSDVGETTETDGLFLVEDVAVVVEAKGRTIADAARRGDVTRFQREVDKILGSGAEQARRLGALIEVNGGVWLENGQWLDLSQIEEVRTIVVGVDLFGPLSVGLGDLDRAGMLGQGATPWLTSLHDLDVISRVLDRPAEFLLYLRRRTDSGVATHFRGVDELDLFMLFLDGGLYVQADPDDISAQYPATPPPLSRDRRQHERDARSTFVGTFTDPLDAWMYSQDGIGHEPVEKAQFNSHPDVLGIVDFLAHDRKPGWLRFGADLLGLAGEAQKKLGDGIRETVKRARSDGRWHTIHHAYAGMWGYATLFAGAIPRGVPHDDGVQRLTAYMLAKRHQVRSDRSLGLMLDVNNRIVHVIYMNRTTPEGDADLTALGRVLGLRSPTEPSRPLPPSARRATRRLRGTKAKRRR